MLSLAEAAAEATGVLDRIAAIAPAIAATADAQDAATEIDRATIDRLRSSGMFRLMAPRALGGEEAHPEMLIDAISRLSYLDGSTGWFAGAVMTAGGVAGAFLSDEACAAIFRDGAALAAGQAAPTGKAERVPGGYRISGRFSFGSGTPAADWIVGGYLLFEEGKMVTRASGDPIMMIGFCPRDRTRFTGNWDVLGLRGTGSYDFEVEEQFVPEGYLFTPGETAQKRGGTLYRMGFMALPCLTHASFAIGCARRALDEWRDFSMTKKRGPMGGYASELQTYQRDLAVATADLHAAEAYVRRTFSAIYDAAEAGTVPDGLRLDGRLCASHALQVGSRVAQMAYATCTTFALRNGNALQRAYRDLQAGNAHFLTAEQSWIDAGRVLAGIEGAAVVF